MRFKIVTKLALVRPLVEIKGFALSVIALKKNEMAARHDRRR